MLHLRLRLPHPSKHNSFPSPPNNPNLITAIINPIFTPSNHNPTHIAQSFRSYKTLAATTTTSANNGEGEQGSSQHKSFWGAVSLIIGTAVGPGMLGLPAETIRSGPLPSTIAILVSWVYVISSIILVAELSFAAMEEDGVEEVSFTGLATKALGSHFGAFIAVVYACLSFALTNLFASFGHASWSLPSILPAIPVTVLTLGFHVITPFICKIAGNTIAEARKAILIGGSVPLIMVLSWNLSVLGLSGAYTTASSRDPVSLLLSVNPSALSAVQGFAFSALATSLIGYAVSFPKQLLDTLQLIGKINLKKQSHSEIQLGSEGNGFGRVGFAVYSGRHNLGNAGRASFTSSGCTAAAKAKLGSSINIIVMPLVLGVPVLIASFFRSTFSRALDFAGLYANCFLFGILPPAMAYIHQSRKKSRSSILPGGDGALLLLFGIAVILGIWH
ncbi:tyrosine-specific transport protein [Prunus yedoensis var. nudiflora]|uniref:Tyrosine-specific transport protein n=1 Tax=Prunus yedoensis var. nudiflora TaxID=2094558 RepID=A0A314YAR2_PRUYE|nr:tyrosine-specific transport protein [Prunus yedoensis var. nudiflora]